MKHGLLRLAVAMGLVVGFLPMPAKADFAIGVAGTAVHFNTTGTEEENWGAGGTKGTETNTGSASRNFGYGSVFMEFIGKNTWGGMTVGLEYVPGDAVIGTKSKN